MPLAVCPLKDLRVDSPNGELALEFDSTQENPEKGREAAAPSFIKEIEEVQGGKKCHTMVAQSSPKMPK
jgi:hypothetical protein